MKFDAYAGNAREVGAEQLAELLSFGTKGRVQRGKPRGRYTDVFEVANMPTDGSVWVGLDRELEAAYFECKGQSTPEAVATLRRHFPDGHTVSRLDSCEDYNDAKAYRQLVATIDSACDPRVKSHAWQPRGEGAEEQGATTYWGSPQSRVMVRVYEAGKMKERAHYGKPHWARAEAQIRPGKAAEKALAAQISALEAWGFAKWSQRAAALLAHVEVPRYAPETGGVSYEKTTLYAARAFRRHWVEMLADYGTWECIGREFETIWAMDDAAKAKRQ